MFPFFKKTYPVGIDISDYSIEVLQLNKRREVLAYGRTLLEEGIVEDGKILKKETLAAKIVEALSSTKPVSLKKEISKVRAVMSLPESKTFFHFMQLPAELAGEELRARVAREASKVIPFAAEEVYWDYIVHGEVTNKGEKSIQSVLYAAVPQKIADAYGEVAELAGIKLAALDVESASAGRALLSKTRADSWLSTLAEDFELRKGTMIVDIGARATTVSIFDNEGTLTISSTIRVGGSTFTRSIAKQLGVSLERAEEMKRSLGFDKKKRDNKVLSVLQADFQKILTEIRALADYYERTKDMGIGEVILTGGSSLIPDVDAYLAMNLDQKVRLGNPLEKISSQVPSHGKKLFDKKTPPILFSNVIGLALRGVYDESEEQNINLLPPGYMHEKKHAIIFKGAHRDEPQTGAEKKEEQTPAKERAPISLRVGASRALIAALIALILLGGVGFVAYRFVFVSQTSVVVPGKASQIEAPVPAAEEKLSTLFVTAPAKESAIIEKPPMVTIGDTPTGWLRVREGPGTTYAEVAKVNPGEEYELLEEKSGWYKIKLDEAREGWVFGGYATKK